MNTETECPDCAGEGKKYVSMCDKHKAEAMEKDARRMGVPDLTLSVQDPLMWVKIREKLPLSRSGYLLVKILP